MSFTASTTSLLNLIATDVGRPLADISPKFSDDHLLPDAEQVLRNLQPIEKEVRTDAGGWCLRRILPYRTRDRKVEGVVITFTDVTRLKAAMEQERRLATVLRDSNDAVLVYDLQGRIRSWNRGAERMYGYSEAEAVGVNVAILIPASAQSEARAV